MRDVNNETISFVGNKQCYDCSGGNSDTSYKNVFSSINYCEMQIKETKFQTFLFSL